MMKIDLSMIACLVSEIKPATLRLLGDLLVLPEPGEQFKPSEQYIHVRILYNRLEEVLDKAQEAYRETRDQTPESLIWQLLLESRSIAEELYAVSDKLARESLPLPSSTEVQESANNLKRVIKESLILDSKMYENHAYNVRTVEDDLTEDV